MDPSVFGEAAKFSASGRMALSGERGAIQGHFQVQRLGVPEERAWVQWVLETNPESLKLDLHLVEPEDGMLSRLAGVRPGASRLLVSGQGPPDDWQGRIQAESLAWGEIQSEVRVRAAWDRLALEARGGLRLRESLVPQEMNGLLDLPFLRLEGQKIEGAGAHIRDSQQCRSRGDRKGGLRRSAHSGQTPAQDHRGDRSGRGRCRRGGGQVDVGLLRASKKARCWVWP